MSETILVGVIAGLALLLAYRGYRDEMDGLKRRVDRLEEAGQKRINYRSLEEIENAISAAIVMSHELDIRRDIFDNLVAHLHKARDPEEKEK